MARPILQAYDNDAFTHACAQSDWPCDSFQLVLAGFPELLLQVDWDPDTWDLYRAWAIVRALGRWLLNVFGGDGLVRILDRCPLCHAPKVEVAHLFSACLATHDLYLLWASANTVEGADRMDWARMQLELFMGRVSMLAVDELEGASRIHFVGTACKRTIRAHLNPAGGVVL